MKKIRLSLFAALAMCAAAVVGMAASAKDAVVTFAKETAVKAHEAVTGFMFSQGLMLGVITSNRKDAQHTARGPMSYSHFDDAAVPAAISLLPGFKPRYVCVENATDRIKYEWYDGMAKTDCIMTIANGTRTLDTGSKLSVDITDGFQPTITVAAAQVLQNKQFRAYAF